MRSIKEFYYLDGMKIISKTPFAEVRKVLPIDKLKKFCKEVNIGKFHHKTKAWNFGYMSWVEFSVPEKKFFKLLNQYHSLLGKYNFTKVEIANDSLCSSESDSLVKFETEILRKCIRKYSSDYILWNEGNDEEMKPNPNKTKEKYGDNTLYFTGGCNEKKRCSGTYNSWNFAAYPRLCKVKEFYHIPAVHTEFRIHRAGKVKKYTGLKKIEDGINFDAELTYKFLEYKFIAKYNGINFDRLGRFIGNYSTQVKEVKKALRGGKYYYPALQMAGIYCEINKIQYPFQLRKTILSEIKEAKNRKGRLYPGTLRLKKLSHRRFKSFFVPEGHVFTNGRLSYNK